MKKPMKKTIMATILVATMILGAPSAFANVSAFNEARSIQLQADALIATVDKNSLMVDAMENVIDYSVPISVRESIVASADFKPMVGIAQDAIEIEVNSTVQKVGEIVRENGDISNMYVTAVAAEPKEDWAYKGQYGIKAWAYVYWIDNQGENNELYAAAAEWLPQDEVVDNRQVRYGTSDITGSFWVDGPTVQYPTDNYRKYIDPRTYSGLTLRCQTKIDVVNVGTVTCNVTSGFFTK